MATVAIAAAMTASGPEPAVAQSKVQMDQCAGKNRETPNERIKACTALIQAGAGSAKQRSEIFKIRATVEFYRNNFAQAVRDYGEAIKLDPQNSEALDNRCWTLATLNRAQEALKDCNEALRLRPNHAPTMDTLGFVYLKLGQYDRAIVTYDAALKLTPKSVYSLYGRGIAKLKSGDAAGGNADIAASKAIKDVSKEMAGYGIP